MRSCMRGTLLLCGTLLLISDRRNGTDSHDASRQTRLGMLPTVAENMPASSGLSNNTPAPACPLRPLRSSRMRRRRNAGSNRPSGGDRVIITSRHGANTLTGKRLNGPWLAKTRVGRVECVAVSYDMTMTLKVTDLASIHNGPAKDGAISGECKALLFPGRGIVYGNGDDPFAIEQRPLEWSWLVQVLSIPLPLPKVAKPGHSAADKSRSCNTAHALAAERRDPLRL